MFGKEEMKLREYVDADDALFHYTEARIAIEHILNSRRFKPSILYDMNDPTEYKFRLLPDPHGSFPATRAPTDESLEKLLVAARNDFNRILRFEYKVMSFCSKITPTLILIDGSREKDKYFCSKGWDRCRMWSQYGENQYGICLVLSKEEVEKALQRQTREYKADYVLYIQGDADRPSFDYSLLGQKSPRECVHKYVTDNVEEFFFRKNIDYRDEAEFRVVVFDTDKTLEYLDIGASLKGVIVGDRTDRLYNIDRVKEMCRQLEIECLKAHWSTSSPRMVLC